MNFRFKTFLLWGGCCLALLTPAVAQTNTNGPAAKSEAKVHPPRRVDVNEFEQLWKDKTNVVLDVRSPKEFSAGHIPGAVNLDVNSPDFTDKVSALPKDKVYLVHCAAGVRSARACQKMNSLGFDHLIDLAPGFKAWQQAGKPVEK
jgi:rhodanese-related sulfurtransferase